MTGPIVNRRSQRHRASRYPHTVRVPARHAPAKPVRGSFASTLLVLVAVDLSHVNWQVGNIGEWVAGLATAAAVIIALSGLRAERRARQLDERERLAQKARAEKSQATQLRVNLPGGGGTVGGRYDWACQIVNASVEPFFDIDVVATMANDEVFQLPRVRVIQSGEEPRYNLPQTVYSNGDASPQVVMTYTDHVDLRWSRDPDGRVSRLSVERSD